MQFSELAKIRYFSWCS